MAENEDTDIEQLLSQMHPDIAQLMREMMTRRPANWEAAKSMRDRIVHLNRIAMTDQEQGSLCFAFLELMHSVERDALVAPESVAQLKPPQRPSGLMRVVSTHVPGTIAPLALYISGYHPTRQDAPWPNRPTQLHF